MTPFSLWIRRKTAQLLEERPMTLSAHISYRSLSARLLAGTLVLTILHEDGSADAVARYAPPLAPEGETGTAREARLAAWRAEVDEDVARRLAEQDTQPIT